MSKTAEEWATEGDKLDDDGKREEAMICFDKAIALNPNYARAYYLKAYVGDNLKRPTEEVINLYKKALELGHDSGYNLGCKLNEVGRNVEAVEAYKKCLERNPNKMVCWENIGDAYMQLERNEEAIHAYYKTLELDPQRDRVHPFQALLLEDVGRDDEAMRQYDACLKLNPRNNHAIIFKGNLLSKQGKYKEALAMYESVNSNPPEPEKSYRMGNAYMALGNKEKAMEMYNHAPRMVAEYPVGYCYRGQCYYLIGKKDLAMKDFKTVQEQLDAKQWNYSPSQVKAMRQIMNSITETEEAEKKAEEALKQMDQKNAATQKFMQNVKKLQEERNKVQQDLMKGIDKKQTAEGDQNLSALNKIKEEFNSQLAQMRAEMTQAINEVKTAVVKLANHMEEMKEEIANKMDDFDKKLTAELNKQDVSAEDQKKLKGYFKAFVGTFSSTHVTSQVIDSGQVQIDSDNSAATFLSVLASFTPFVGSVLQSGIKSLGDFLQSKEMKTNARKMKTLAHDATSLSQIVGKAAFNILMDKKKQREVIEVTDKDLREKTKNIFKQLSQFCADLNEKIDAALYSALYKTAAERTGHNDANDLIEKWIKGDIAPHEVEEQFVEETLSKNQPPAVNNNNDETASPKKEQPAAPSACCNMF